MVIGKYSLDSLDKVFFYFIPKRVRKMKIILFAFAFWRGWRNRDLEGILSIESVNQIDLVFWQKDCRYYEVVVCLLKFSDNNQFWSTKLKPKTSVKVLTYFIPNKTTGSEFAIELVTMKTFASNSVLLVK